MANPTHHIQNLLEQKKHPLIFISGLPAAGKTTLSKQLQNDFENAVVIQGDWFIKHPTFDRLDRIIDAEKNGNTQRIENERNPINWFDWDALQQAIEQLTATGSLTISSGWDQKTGDKNVDITLNLPEESAPIICECAYLLHLPLINQVDCVVLVDTLADVANQRLYDREGDKFSEPFLTYENFLAYRETLTEKYDLPYFAVYRHHADIILKDNH